MKTRVLFRSLGPKKKLIWAINPTLNEYFQALPRRRSPWMHQEFYVYCSLSAQRIVRV